MNMLIYNVLIFTNDAENTILKNHAVAIEGTQICAVGQGNELKVKYSKFKQIDGGGRLLMPGLINSHMHFYGTYARGLALKKAPKNFHQILSELWWKLDSALDLESIYYGTLVQVISAIKHGVTSFVDHHASPNAVSGSLDKVEEALKLLGLRGVLCYEISDRDGREICQLGLQENARYIQKCKLSKTDNPDHLFDGMVGLHASFTLDETSLQHAAELSKTEDRGCHIHVLEDKVDLHLTQKKYGKSVVQRLVENGILGKKSIAAHCIHLDEQETEILIATDTMVVHNPQSNMNNAVGRADIFKLMDAGVLVGIGSDGMSPDMAPDVRTANLLHKHDLKNSNTGWVEIQKLLLKNNPKIFARLTGQKVGRVERGYLADLILVDYFPPTPMDSNNFWGHYLFGIADATVDTTIINGRLIMQNKSIPGLDEAAIAVHSRGCAAKVWKKFAEL